MGVIIIGLILFGLILSFNIIGLFFYISEKNNNSTPTLIPKRSPTDFELLQNKCKINFLPTIAEESEDIIEEDKIKENHFIKYNNRKSFFN